MQSYDASHHDPPAPIAHVTLRNPESRLIAPDGNLIQEAGVDDEEVLIATLDMKQATGWLARRSVELGVLGDWWKAGVERVRILE